MSSAVDLTSFAAILKTLYPDGVPENVASRNRVWLSMVNKKDGFTGANMVQPIFYGNPQGRAATFSNAQANVTSSKQIAWTITRAHDYALLTIDAETIAASRDNRGAFVEARKQEIDMMLDELGRSASLALYGNGSGALAQVSSATATTNGVITLLTAEAGKNFSVGQWIVAYSAETGGSQRGSVAVQVTAVDEDNGLVTFTGGPLTGLTANDYLFTDGDRGNKMKGLAGWLPLTAPTSGDNWFGVDRSVDPVRLAGCRLATPSSSIEENLLTLNEKIVRVGGKPNMALLSHSNFASLAKELGSKVIFPNGNDGRGDVGFGSLYIHSSSGVLRVYPDPDCPSDRGYVLTSSSFTLHHLMGFPHLDTMDGNQALRQATSDGIEVRARYWGQLVCKAPAWNGVCQLA